MKVKGKGLWRLGGKKKGRRLGGKGTRRGIVDGKGGMFEEEEDDWIEWGKAGGGWRGLKEQEGMGAGLKEQEERG